MTSYSSVAEMIAELKKPVCLVLSGAGLSADSGIPTFRGVDGLWENHRVEDVAEHEAYFRNPELVLRFYQERFENYKVCKPHAGHFALAKLEEKYKVIHVTQNIDNLLEQAGCKKVVHVHGSCFVKKCEWHRDIVQNYSKFRCTYKKDTNEAPRIGETCPECGGQLRPDIVFFNEIAQIRDEDLFHWMCDINDSDGVFICVGTSLQVYPVAGMIRRFNSVKNKYIVDIDPPNIFEYNLNYDLIKGSACEELPKLVDKLMEI